MDDDEMHPVVRVVMTLLAASFWLWSTWCTVVAFTGGRLPIVGWHLAGGLDTGLLWVFVLDPILMTLGYWIAALVVMPLSLIFRPRRRS